MNRIKVMVVDDSAVARQVVVGLLQEDPGVEVIAAVSDPLFAMQRMQTQWPDVITPRCRNAQDGWHHLP